MRWCWVWFGPIHLLSPAVSVQAWLDHTAAVFIKLDFPYSNKVWVVSPPIQGWKVNGMGISRKKKRKNREEKGGLGELRKLEVEAGKLEN